MSNFCPSARAGVRGRRPGGFLVGVEVDSPLQVRGGELPGRPGLRGANPDDAGGLCGRCLVPRAPVPRSAGATVCQAGRFGDA
jgi:hypothetical protein